MSKYRVGQKFASKDGKAAEVVSLARNVHRNNSRLLVKFSGFEGQRWDGEQSLRTNDLTAILLHNEMSPI